MCGPRFTISLKRSTLIFSYRQADRPITPSLGHFRQIGTVATLRGCLLRPESGHWELSTRLRGTKVGSKVAAEFFWRGRGVGVSHFLSSGPEPSGRGAGCENVVVGAIRVFSSF